MKDELSSSGISKPARKSLDGDLEDDERTVPIQEAPSHGSSPSTATPAGNEKQKLSRQEKLAAQKLGRERERTARAAAALDEKGNKLFERGYFDKAMICYSKALKMKRRTFTNMLEDADDFDESSKKLSKGDSQVLVSMATSINNIGYLRQRSGDANAEETMAAYQKSLRIKRRILGNDSLSVGKTLNNIGSVYYLTRDFNGALNAYKEAMNIMKANLGEDHPDIGTVLSNMGDVYLANRQDEKSLEYYRLALNVRYANFGKHDPRVVRLLEKIAKIEIGDKMIPQGETDMGNVDWEENALTDLGMKPLAAEYSILNGELKADIEYMDQLQQRMTTNMVEDEVVIVKGMQELPESSSFDDSVGDASYGQDDDVSQTSQLETEDNEEDAPLPSEEDEPGRIASPRKSRLQALQHINNRLERIRSSRNVETGAEGRFEDDGDDDRNTGQSVSTASSNELYVQLYGQLDDDDDLSVSSSNSDELFGQFYGPLKTQPQNAQYRPPSLRSGMGAEQNRVIVTS